MKNMKKFSGLIALICVLLSVMLLVSACGNTSDGDKATTENTTASTEAPTTEAPSTEASTTGGTDDPVTPPDDGKVTYKVTILADVGVNMEGILVQMCDDSGCKLPAATNADGVVEFRYAPSNYHVTLSNLPAGYTCEGEYYFTNNELKIVLKKLPTTVTYKVEVVDHEGFVLEGVTVTPFVYGGGDSISGAKTNSDGIVTFELPEGSYGVELSDIPEGFGMETSYFFAEGKNELKIALTALPAYTLTAQDLFGQMVANVEVKVFQKGTENLIATKTTGTDGKVTFYLAEGEYTVTASNPAGYTLTSTGLEFSATNKNLVAFYLDGVSGEKSYQVVVMDSFYQGLAEVKVTIYKLSDDSLVREVLTNDLGMIDILLPVDDYYAVVELPDGYSVLENKFLFNEDRVAEVVLEGGSVPTFDYTILVENSTTGAPIPGVTVTLMNSMTEEIIGTAVSGADGVAIFAGLESGMYMGTVKDADLPEGYTVAFDAYFYGMMTDSTLSLERAATGAEDAPFIIEDEETTIVLGEGKTLYYYIGYAADKIITINNANAVIKIGENVYTAVDGVLTITFEKFDEEPKLLAIYTADGAAAEFTLSFKGVLGTMDNPIVLENLGDYTASIEAESDGIYYRWTATQSGVLVLKTNNALSNCIFMNYAKDWYTTGSSGDVAIYMAIEEGDVIDIYVDSKYDMETGSKPANEILFNLSVVAGTESEPVEVNSKLTDLLMPAGGKIYYTINNVAGMKMLIQVGWGDNPIVTYNGVQYTVNPDTGMIKIVFEGTDPAIICVESAEGLAGSFFTISNANGSGTMDDPFVLNTLDSITVSVPENDNVVYTWTATASGTLTLTMNSALNNVCVNNLTTSVYGDYTMGELTTSVAVNEGDIIQIGVGTAPDETWNCPAADIEISFTLA